MFLSKLILAVPTEVEKLLLEQQDTLQKLEILSKEVKKIKDNSSPDIIKNMYDASNTLQNPIFDTSKITILEKADRFFGVMDKIGHYISHPILIANVVAGASYWVCLIIAMGGVLYYLVGHKKGLHYTSGSIVSYTLIQAINMGLNSL